MVYMAALKFISAGDPDKHSKERRDSPMEDGAIEDIEGQMERGLTEEAEVAGFGVCPDKLAAIVGTYDIKSLRKMGGVEGLAARLGVSLNEGVNSSDVPIRQDVYGSNKFTEKPFRSFWSFVMEALCDITLVILMACAAVSIGVGLATEGWPKGAYDGLGIILCIFLVVFVTAVSDYRQSLQFCELDKEKKNISVQVTRDGCRQKVSIYDLVVGDVFHLSIGDLVPADGVFISGYSLLIDQSSLSGESMPVNIHEKRPFVLSGTRVQDGSAKALVTAVGTRTEWGKLVETLSERGEDETPLQVKLNCVATIIGRIGLAFAALTFLVLVIRFLVEKALRHEFAVWSSADAVTLLNYFATAVTIIVVAVPEGLPLAVTLSLAFAMKQLMDNKALVRQLSACETMGSATCICTDKTGTLTSNHMKVIKAWICGKVKMTESGKCRSNVRSEISEQVLPVLLQAIFLNTGAEVVKDKEGKRSVLGSPTESAILEYGMLLGGDFDDQRKDCRFLKVEPFNSENKKMAVLMALSDGKTRAFCKGASEIVLRMCSKTIGDNGEIVPLCEGQVENIMGVINEFAGEALRTLCLSFKDTENGCTEHNIPDKGHTLIAVVGIKDPIRPGVKDAVKTCLAAGIRVQMVTGDNINTAKAIARECGILTDDGIAIEGHEFRSKTPDEMRQIIHRIQVMARSSPLDKHMLVRHLRDMFNEVVAATGDGTNDAPALHEADIGLAMGISGTEVAKESADVIVLDDNFTTIVNVAKWGRAVYTNIQKFVQFQLTVNVAALVISFLSACISGSAPLTTVQLLWVNLIMDTLAALALATEPPHKELMNRPPVGRDTGFITNAMWRNIIGQSLYQLAVLSVFSFMGKQLLRLEGSDARAVLNTFIFNTFVFCQIFNEISCRHIDELNVFRGLFNSWIFIAVMVSTVAFQVIIVELLGTFASTVPQSWQLWMLSILIGAAGMIVAVVLKLIPIEEEPAKLHDGYDLLPSGPDQA